MMGNYHVRFGGGPMEKCPNGQLASGLPYGTGVRKMSAVAFGGAAALGATTLMTALFPLGGALF